MTRTIQTPTRSTGSARLPLHMLSPKERFHRTAQPISVKLNHADPPAVDNAEEPSQADSELIVSSRLIPTTFLTGCFGWKGIADATMEVVNAETGLQEKVDVVITINAVVVGQHAHAKGSA